MQGIFQKENTDKALKYGIYRHLPTYEKIIRNLVSFCTYKQKGQRMERLISQARKGDPDAFTALMESQMQNMYKAARSVLCNDEDIADAISDTILVCWEKFSQLKEDRYFRTWMTRILLNKCTDILRKRKQMVWMDEIPETPDVDAGFENSEWKEALNSLSESFRLVVMLYYIEGFKTSEISQILDIPEGTVRSRLARGREQLAGLFQVKVVN